MTAVYIIGFILLILLVLYLLAIMPQMLNRPSYDNLMGYFYAHRGFHGDKKIAPENSMKAFHNAVEKGYGIELDVQLSKDLVPVVFHDENLKRVCGADHYLNEYTYEELQQFTLYNSKEQIPKLEDVLELVSGQVPLIVEIKCEDGNTTVCQYAYELLQEYKGIYCVESFHPLAVAWFRKNAPQIVRGQLSTDFFRDGDKRFVMWWLGHLFFNFLSKPDFIAYDCRYRDECSRRICRTIYKSLSVAWTVKSRQELEEIKGDFDLFIFENFEPDHKCRK